jgi:hypothetical protein
VEQALEILEAFKKGDSRQLRELSDKVMVHGFIEKDRALIRLAVVAHSLSKIAEKTYYKQDKEFWEGFMRRLGELFDRLAADGSAIGELEQVIIDLDRHFGRYKDHIIHYSQIRRGSTLYAWGMSLTLASKLVGVPEYELMRQVGKTKIVDEEGLGKPVSQRLTEAEEAL